MKSEERTDIHSCQAEINIYILIKQTHKQTTNTSNISNDKILTNVFF